MEEDGSEVDSEANGEPNDHGDRHQLPEVVNDLSEIEEPSEVKGCRGDEGDVEAGQGVASVGEGFIVERGDGETFEKAKVGEVSFVDSEGGERTNPFESFQA